MIDEYRKTIVFLSHGEGKTVNLKELTGKETV